MQSHEGFIEVETKPAAGTEVTLFLPVSGIVQDLDPANAQAATAIPGGTETILFVEDERHTRETALEYFSEKGYTLLLAENGEQGVEQFKKHKDTISLILCDYGLPVFNGEEVFSKIRTINATTPFLLLSGFLEPEKRSSLLSMGVSAIVQKPYKPNDILSLARNVLDRKSPAPNLPPPWSSLKQ